MDVIKTEMALDRTKGFTPVFVECGSREAVLHYSTCCYNCPPETHRNIKHFSLTSEIKEVFLWQSLVHSPVSCSNAGTRGNGHKVAVAVLTDRQKEKRNLSLTFQN